MRRSLFLIAALVVAPMSFAAPSVEINTSQGRIVLELDAEKAPKTVENFLRYVKDNFYQGVIFHRVIPGFMIQGGGFEPGMKEKKARAPIKNEADNGLKNKRGAIAMARTGDPHSASAQFFINVVDNDFLDYRTSSGNGWGYCVFGKVTQGMEVVDKIVGAPTKRVGPFEGVPVEPIIIQSIAIRSEK
ncbi:MAG: peptidyl-prolyl cis-trans isomerase [Zoogloeaceae bacterium]|jgi:cyclophilin family peptidyl-prolyl cis-trans isomerase|nr:peptidyl-prolyl cis-trans isomerase [Zoogloeaceae bacterium]